MNTMVEANTLQEKEIQYVTYEEHIQNVIDMIETFKSMYGSKRLPDEMRNMAHNIYKEALPINVRQGDYDFRLYDKEGTLIAYKFDRVVIGDFGVYYEFNANEIAKENIKVMESEAYRLNESYKDYIKNYVYTAKDDSNIRINFQLKEVKHIDYTLRKFYVSAFDVKIKKEYM